MLERRVTVINDLGLHARAAAQVVRTARRFTSQVTLTNVNTGECANAKSILTLLHLAAGIGVTITLTAEGDDESDAIAAIEALFLNGFGEM